MFNQHLAEMQFTDDQKMEKSNGTNRAIKSFKRNLQLSAIKASNGLDATLEFQEYNGALLAQDMDQMSFQIKSNGNQGCALQ